MFDSFLLLLMLSIVFGGLFMLAKYTMKLKNVQNQYNIGKVITSFSISPKTSGHIIEVGGKHYLCCEGSGIIEVSLTEEMKDAMETNAFKEVLAKDFKKIANIKEQIKNSKIKN